MLAPFVGELDRIAPSFKINGSQIQVLQSPAEFYETLKDRIRKAERRIFLSTLYIGKSERELVRTAPPIHGKRFGLTRPDCYAARGPPREARP
jgi:phosphatidylserine/phosphatidylglycerophosphate/cardiolipin synthase-like enzyme